MAFEANIMPPDRRALKRRPDGLACDDLYAPTPTTPIGDRRRRSARSPCGEVFIVKDP
jgi:hypothetical protein